MRVRAIGNNTNIFAYCIKNVSADRFFIGIHVKCYDAIRMIHSLIVCFNIVTVLSSVIKKML